jgi:hypothetical protein
MNVITKLSILSFFAMALGVCILTATPAEAVSSYFTSKGCVSCHPAPATATCAGCHQHSGTLSASKNKTTAYAPGETVTITLTASGARSGWIGARLYNQNGAEIARSTGNQSGMGGATTYPAVLSAPAPATAGTYTWKVAYLGNNNGSGHSEKSVNVSITVAAATPGDTTAPTVSTFTLPATSSSLTVPVSTLTATDNVAVTGYLVTTSATQPAASAAGWNAAKPASVTAPAEGSVTFYAWAKDAAGNVSASRSATVTVTVAVADTTNPTLTLSMLADGATTSNPTLNVSGNASDNVALQSVTVNGSSVPVDAAGNFSTAVELAEGPNTITVIATDAAGNSRTLSRTVTYTASAPATLTINAPVDNLVSAQELLTVEGTADENATVTVRVNEGAPQVASLSGTAFTADVNLEPGINTIDIQSTDPVGTVSTAKRTVVLDTDSPTVAITRPAEDKIVRNRTIIVKGTVADALSDVTITLAVDGVEYRAKVVDGMFSKRITFSGKGSHTITVTATDEAGNQSTATRNVILKNKLSTAVQPPADSGSSQNGSQTPTTGSNLPLKMFETILLGSAN